MKLHPIFVFFHTNEELSVHVTFTALALFVTRQCELRSDWLQSMSLSLVWFRPKEINKNCGHTISCCCTKIVVRDINLLHILNHSTPASTEFHQRLWGVKAMMNWWTSAVMMSRKISEGTSETNPKALARAEWIWPLFDHTQYTLKHICESFH